MRCHRFIESFYLCFIYRTNLNLIGDQFEIKNNLDDEVSRNQVVLTNMDKKWTRIPIMYVFSCWTKKFV